MTDDEIDDILLTCMADNEVCLLNVTCYRTFESISLQTDVRTAVSSGKKGPFSHLKHQTLVPPIFKNL